MHQPCSHIETEQPLQDSDLSGYPVIKWSVSSLEALPGDTSSPSISHMAILPSTHNLCCGSNKEKTNAYPNKPQSYNQIFVVTEGAYVAETAV